MPQTRLSVRYQPTFSGFEQATLSRGSAALAVPRATPKASRGDDAASFSYRNVSMSRVISGLHQTPADAPRRVGTRAPGKVCLGRSGAGLGYSVCKCQPGWRSQALGRGWHKAGRPVGEAALGGQTRSPGRPSPARHPRRRRLQPCGAGRRPLRQMGLCVAETPRSLCASVSGRRLGPCRAGPTCVCLPDGRGVCGPCSPESRRWALPSTCFRSRRQPWGLSTAG